MYCKGSNKAGVNSGETSWRSYSKSLIVELKEKIADRRARTLALLSENGDLAAFNEIDTGSDGLEDTSTNITNSEDLPGKDGAVHQGQGADMNSLSDTSSLTGSDYNDGDIQQDDFKLSPGASHCGNPRCCSQSCSTITSVSGGSYTSEDVSSRSLDDFVADASLGGGIPERNHPCPHSVDVRCSLCLIETKLQVKYSSVDCGPEPADYRMYRLERDYITQASPVYSRELVSSLNRIDKRTAKAKSDTWIVLQSKRLSIDSNIASAGILIRPGLAEINRVVASHRTKPSSTSRNSVSHLEFHKLPKDSPKLLGNVRTASGEPEIENIDCLQEYLEAQEGVEAIDDHCIQKNASNEEVEEVTLERVSADSNDKGNINAMNITTGDTEVTGERDAELDMETTEVEENEDMAQEYEEQQTSPVLHGQEQAENDECEEQQHDVINERRDVNDLEPADIHPRQLTSQSDLGYDDILDNTTIITVENEDMADLSFGFNSCLSEFNTGQGTLQNEVQESDHKSVSRMKQMLHELIRIFEDNSEFCQTVNKSVVGMFEGHCADFDMLLSVYENKSGNSGYTQSGKNSSSRSQDQRGESNSSGSTNCNTALNDQSRSLQACLEKARLANTLQEKMGRMRSMATNVAVVKAYEQTIVDLEKTMMNYLQVYTKEATESLSHNSSQAQQANSESRENSQETDGENRQTALRRSDTFVLREICARKPPSVSKRRDTSAPTTLRMSERSKTFHKDIEEEADASKSEDSQNVPHPSPTFLVTEDSKSISGGLMEIRNHLQPTAKDTVIDTDVTFRFKKSPQTSKGPRCLLNDTDFDSDTSDSLSEVKETARATYTSSLLTQLLDYNSADECRTVKEKAERADRKESAEENLETKPLELFDLYESFSGSSKQHRLAQAKMSRNVKRNQISKKAAAPKVPVRSGWLSLDGNEIQLETFDKKSVNDIPEPEVWCVPSVDSPGASGGSETVKGLSKSFVPQGRGGHVESDLAGECEYNISSTAHNNGVFPGTSSAHSVKEAVSQAGNSSSRQNICSLSDTASTVVEKRSNEKAKHQQESQLNEAIDNQPGCSWDKETPGTSNQMLEYSSERHVGDKEASKIWQLTREGMSEKLKKDTVLTKLDWSSSDDEAVDDVPRDVSPSHLLRQKQKRDVDHQLENLHQYYNRTRKSRSPLRRTTSVDISQWVETVQNATRTSLQLETSDLFADSFPLHLQQSPYDVLTAQAYGEACSSVLCDTPEEHDNSVFVSPSQLLYARNQAEEDTNDEDEFAKLVKEQTQHPETCHRTALSKEEQLKEEVSHRSLSVSSTSDEYILSDSGSVQVNTSRDNLKCASPEDAGPATGVTNPEPEEVDIKKIVIGTYVEVCNPREDVSVGDSVVTARVNDSSTHTHEGDNALNWKETFINTNSPSQSLKQVTCGSQYKVDTCESPLAPETPVHTSFRTCVRSNTDSQTTSQLRARARETVVEAELVSSDLTGDGVNTTTLDNEVMSICHFREEQRTHVATLCAPSKQPSRDSKAERQVKDCISQQNTMHTSQPGTNEHDMNRYVKRDDRLFCDLTSVESFREERTDVSAIRERWKQLEDSNHVAVLNEPGKKQHFKNGLHHLKHQSGSSSISSRTLIEDATCDVANKDIQGPEKYGGTGLSELPWSCTLLDESGPNRSQTDGILNEYQAIDALRYKVYRLEQMVQNSDINTVNFHHRHTTAADGETLQSEVKGAPCSHRHNTRLAQSRTLTRCQCLPELSCRQPSPCVDHSGQYFRQSRGFDAGQVFRNGHELYVGQHIEGMCLDNFEKQYASRSSRVDDMHPCNTTEPETHVHSVPERHQSDVDTGAVLKSLEERVALVQEQIQEIKNFSSNTHTLMSGLQEMMNNFASLTSTAICSHSTKLDTLQTLVSEELKHFQENLRARDVSTLVAEYARAAEQNIEVVLETVRSQSQDMVAKTAQTLEEAISPIRESMVFQKKESEDIKSSLENIILRLDEKRPEPSRKTMNHDLMKERIVELTSQRDAEKVFHRITRQALRALEKDHDRLRQEYVRATCRRYNTNESESQKRVWYYLNNDDKCPHNKNHSNKRATQQLHEVSSPRGSPPDGDTSSSSSSAHDYFPHANFCHASCHRLQSCRCAAAGYRPRSEVDDCGQVCKNTGVFKCVHKTRTDLALCVHSQENRGVFDFSRLDHSPATAHGTRLPKKSKFLETSGFADTDVKVTSKTHEAPVHMSPSEMAEMCTNDDIDNCNTKLRTLQEGVLGENPDSAIGIAIRDTRKNKVNKITF